MQFLLLVLALHDRITRMRRPVTQFLVRDLPVLSGVHQSLVQLITCPNLPLLTRYTRYSIYNYVSNLTAENKQRAFIVKLHFVSSEESQTFAE